MSYFRTFMMAVITHWAARLTGGYILSALAFWQYTGHPIDPRVNQALVSSMKSAMLLWGPFGNMQRTTRSLVGMTVLAVAALAHAETSLSLRATFGPPTQKLEAPPREVFAVLPG